MVKTINIPKINPLKDSDNRPFWSVMITTYNRTDYLEKCIKSVISQNFSPEEMQIEVVDDHSQKDIKEIVDIIGNNRVSFYRQPQNVGIYANWNTCIERAKGRWIHILSDDDLVAPEFYQAYGRMIEKYHPSVVIGQSKFIDENDKETGISPALQESEGILNNALQVLAVRNLIRTPGIVISREAYEKVGGFTSDLLFTPDWEMWTRLAESVKIAYINLPYSFFRLHSASETSRLVLTGEYVTDNLDAAKIIHARINNLKERKKTKLEFNQWLSSTTYYYAQKILSKNLYLPGLKMAFISLKLSPSIAHFKKITKLLLRSTLNLIHP